MVFDYERKMLVPVKRWLTKQGLLTKSEVCLPWGVCDIVGVSFRVSALRSRIRYRQSSNIGTISRLSLLSRIPDQNTGSSVSLECLKSAVSTFKSENELLSDLDKLEENNFVVVNSDRYQKLNGWAPMHRRIVTVELKLDRVEEVLSQAINHKAAATESYVALPKSVAQRISEGERRETFQVRGIGVLAVTSHSCEVVIKCAKRAPNGASVLEAFCAEKFLRDGLQTLKH